MILYQPLLFIAIAINDDYIIIYIIYIYKLYHTMSRISLLLHDAEAKPMQSVISYEYSVV